MVRRQEKFLNSRRSAMAKTAFSFYFETLSFLSFVSLSSFCFAKKLGAMPSPTPFSPVSSALIIYQKESMELNFEGPEMQK